MLHGGTKDCDEQVALFESGAVPLFLISLKALGTGLNAADTVIVYDPWRNPAAERQAMDRAHRIGQNKPVFVRRLIEENSAEAAIQRMQATKLAPADAPVDGTGQGPRCSTKQTSMRCLPAHPPQRRAERGICEGAFVHRPGNLSCERASGFMENAFAPRSRFDSGRSWQEASFFSPRADRLALEYVLI